ncbi:MAG: branched-chain amino acid ABC transporter permease [Burkholderiales bacterium]|nr:branched-chain amino acid ABC transporter permease [Burkholderiales bacterium]
MNHSSLAKTAPGPAPAHPGRPLLTTAVVALLALALLAAPLYGAATDDSYVLTLVSRILVFALAAVGLNLALGYGGMVSMGHSMYLGLGAYLVLLMHSAGVDSGWLQLAAIAGVTAVVALGVGWVALRTRGIAFIMITLAFAQLFYYLFVSLKAYGGDEGMRLAQASQFGALTGNRTALYYSLLACLGAAAYGTHRLVGSRFGLVLRATRLNERRVKAVGTGALPYRLAAYVLSAVVCAVAGFFLANLTGFVSPAYLEWTVSGELIVMVVLGGVGTVVGPILGAAGMLLVEEGLKGLTDYWPMILGPLIILMVLGLRRGLWSMLPAHDPDAAEAPAKERA